jgi:membrane protease YdiL (CAAX protease family)
MKVTKTISPRESPKTTRPYYHGSVVYVRIDGEAAASPCEPADLAVPGGSVRLRADSLIAAGPHGPFLPAATALRVDGPLRDQLASGLRATSLAPWRKVRQAALALGVLPALGLLELDRELLGSHQATPGRLAMDACLATYVGYELTRRTPRMPGVAAAALVAIALRYGLGASRECGKVGALVWIAMVLALASAAVVLARAPSRDRVALELGDRLGISRSDAFAARALPEASTALVLGAVAASVGLPAMLFALRRGGLAIPLQAAAFIGYAIVVPRIVRRALDPAHDGDRASLAKSVTRASLERVLLATLTGLALAVALVSGTQHLFDAGAELARCTGRLDIEAHRLLAREAAEVAQGVLRVRGSAALFAMIAVAVPLAEERIYRDLLLRVLARRFGASYGLFAAAVLFGFAHVGLYEVALYQTVLLGLAFGLAWLEGGIVSAVVVHAVWNLLLLT